jgi:hypothetical protein
MARRFGGRYSPGSATSGSPPRGTPGGPPPAALRSRAGARSNLLFILPFPFLVSAFRAEPVGLGLNLACFGALMLAAWLTRDGIVAQEAYAARKVARRPAIPRKMLGSALTAAGLACAGLADGSVANALVFGVLGGLFHLGAFGPDPLRDKGLDTAGSVDRAQSDRAERAVREAEAHLAAMTGAVARTGDRELVARMRTFTGTAQKMFRTVQDDPRDLTRARRFLGVYLLGARDAAVKFSDLYARNRDPQARADFLALLDDLERNYADKTETLLIDDRSDLDVEIEVLRERLAREGPPG